MNISLSQNYPVGRDNEPETLQQRIDEHEVVMRLAGYPIEGKAVLVAEPDDGYVGSYQVWWPVFNEAVGTTWIYVNPEGITIEAESPVGS